MKLDENSLPEFLRELRNLLGNIKGVKGRITETFSLSYVLVVDSEEDKTAAETVANMLTEQAAKNHGIDLEIVPVTAAEMEEAAEKFKQYQQIAGSKGSFAV